MDDPGRSYVVLFDARLVEECVLLEERREHRLRRLRFRRERDALYTEGEPEARERRFEELHRRWFERMGLAQPLLRALDEHPSLDRSTRHCIVMPALKADDEGADLRDETPLAGSGVDQAQHGDGRPRPTVILQVRPQTLVDAEALARLLRHELLHLDDMLDPEFGYRSELPSAGGSPAQLRRAAARYRVLWDCTIDGRLHRDGLVGEEIAVLRRKEFEAAFPELGRRADAVWRRWFAGPRPTHGEMAALACEGDAGSSSGICPLCRFSCAELLDGRGLSASALALARDDVRDWEPREGACRQCLDLYAARSAEQIAG